MEEFQRVNARGVTCLKLCTGMWALTGGRAATSAMLHLFLVLVISWHTVDMLELFDYFIIRGEGGGGQGRDEYKDGCDHILGAELSGPAAEKMAMRLATICERETVWDLCDPGVGLELCGDSLLVCNWTSGVWKVGGGSNGEGFRYQDRVDRVVTKLDDLSKLGVRPSSWGRDFTKHEYREGNARADALTHRAREGDCFYWLSPERAFPDYNRQYFELIGLRGKYDGGVDASGVGIGWWLQVGLIPISFHLPHSLQH